MSRLIDADKLIEELEELKQEKTIGYGEFTDGSEVAFTLRELMKIINQQPTSDGWIPVSEKYPVCYEKVLVTVKRDGELGMYGYFYKIAYLKNDGTWSDTVDMGKVLAWMPLPQPYKENM